MKKTIVFIILLTSFAMIALCNIPKMTNEDIRYYSIKCHKEIRYDSKNRPHNILIYSNYKVVSVVDLDANTYK